MNAIPDGYFTHDLQLYGDAVRPRSVLSRGMALTLPDLRAVDNGTRIQFRQQCLAFLGALQKGQSMQIQWSVESDYRDVLARYAAPALTTQRYPWAARIREERASRYHEKMARKELRRERVSLYLGQECSGLSRSDLRDASRLDAYLRQQSLALGERLEHLGRLFTYGHFTVFNDLDHAVALSRFLNPSLSSDQASSLARSAWRPECTMLENTFWGDGLPFKDSREDMAGLYLDGNYHALLVVREWPATTHPGIIYALTNALAGDYAITMNLYPRDTQEEIRRLEEERAELLKQVGDPKKYHLNAEIERKAEKISALMKGAAAVFGVLTVLRVWDPTVAGLARKTLALKAAFQQWPGSRYHQVNHPAQARSLFFETLPGALGGVTRGWDCEAESAYLADLLPLSSAFLGHQDSVDILFDSPQRSLVGLRLFAQGTPQHACLLGMRGAGKSSVTMEVLSQTDHLASFTGIVEEGLSYGTYAQLNGYQSLILRPGADLTWNYLDTQGLPLSAAHRSDAATLALKLVGTSPDEDINRLRLSLISEYINHLYEGVAEDWRRFHESAYWEIAREALVLKRLADRLGVGSTFLDAFIEMRDAIGLEAEQWREQVAQVNEAEVIDFTRDPSTEGLVRDLLFSRLAPEEFPTHGSLCALLRSARLPHHRSEAIAQQLDTIASLLLRWKRSGGLYGPLVDGVTNVRFDGPGLHVELGALGENNKELKEVAGFLALTKIRQRVLSLPRAAAKRLVYEEVGKFLTLPGAAGILAENYAQFRKYKCWVLTVFQNVEQLDRVDPALLKTLRANSTQFWFMRHQDRGSLASMADPIGLPEAARNAILGYPLPEHQSSPKATYFTLFARDQEVPVCGTVKVSVAPEMLYVASSNGETFDERQKLFAAAATANDAYGRLQALLSSQVICAAQS